ncbi:hypothetical protein KDW54_07005 [Burkholderia ambifaria]|uniref:hypothetical protein n=1 Tax=Burkholderia ambifaria TaxID=152480 RepID=UPI001B91FAC3|nr:hypothetical protein [Burkholderia ambifaria]MBR8182144.1 hypothetical protein [Burkholderia ambifaria]
MNDQYNCAAVRVCAISDVQCSRDCGTDACKREREARYTVEQHETAPATHIVDTEWPVKQIGIPHPNDPPTILTVAQLEPPAASGRAALLRDALFYLKGNLPDSPSDHKRKAQVIAGLEELARASSSNIGS